ncbi:putative trans-sialidase [Trypanosoma cruzi]|nr:putative trans-sialidase [Trypanosoma cruzi]
MIPWLQKLRRDGRRSRHTPDKGRDGSIYPQQDQLEGTCCLTTCVDNGESLVRDCGLHSQQFHNGAGRDLNFELVRGTEDGGAHPHRVSRFVKIRGQDAFDTIKLCRTVQENRKLTNLTTAQIERALVHWNATAHSIKRSALRHAYLIVAAYNLNSHVILQLAKHVNPFDPPQHTVQYLKKYTTMLTQVLPLVALI